MATIPDGTMVLIRDALRELPDRCRYHGVDTEPPSGSWRNACCDTGVPARRRQLAEAALAAATDRTEISP